MRTERNTESTYYDVLVVGRPSVDFIFTGLPTWPVVGREIYARDLAVTAGGSFNIVAALNRLGLRSGMIGSVGNDGWSRQAIDAMTQEGVSTGLMQIRDHPMPLLSVCMTHGDDRGFLTYGPEDEEISGSCTAYALSILKQVEAGYLQCCLNPDLAAYARHARQHDMRVIVDCGWDEPWLTSGQVRTLMPLADIVFANAPEACAIAGEPDPITALHRLGEIIPFIVVKRGAAGASAMVHGREYHQATEPVEVIDATGAGDCFNAGFLYGLIHEQPIDECLRYGNICGGMSVRARGGFTGAPTEAQLLERARKKRNA
jgi:sugar/nucleoside kinase (ribokinase family)